MKKTSILVSWIGHADLAAMARRYSKTRREKLRKAVHFLPDADGEGPTRTLVEQVSFDEIHLLANYRPRAVGRDFGKWLGEGVVVHQVDLSDPTDYESVISVVDTKIGEILARKRSGSPELSFHLSPGTPAMAATWLLLGKSIYPADFYQTYRGEVKTAPMEFDLVVDLIPRILREPDAQLQHLTARSPADVLGFEQIAGQSKQIRIAVERARRAALRHVPVLLLGETGTGKEMFASAIHRASPRRDGPFVPINCAAIPCQLLESELFGHRKGAFTGADRDREGAFGEADGGTLFLDEVGELDAQMQSKLLRVLQPPPGKAPCHRVFRRLGDSRDRTADVRLIAATNRDLTAAVRANNFREDLYFRLAVINVKLPPLRERRTDIEPIVKALMAQINSEFRQQEPGYADRRIGPAAMRFIRKHAWPGNVRELYNALLQASVMAAGETLSTTDLSAAAADFPGTTAHAESDHPLGDGFDLTEHLETTHRRYLERAMAEAAGNKSKAARLLGMKHYQTLDAQLKRLGVGR